MSETRGVYDSGGRFVGHIEHHLSVAEHRTVGFRAWSFDAREWCYPHQPCETCAQALSDAGSDPLHAAIELVLLDHAEEISGDKVDPNIAELAYVYEQRTGWTVASELEATDE